MRNWFRFVGSNKRLLNFGFIFNFFSSFGQTFFISLFVPHWIETLHISNAGFGTMYASVTIVSAFLLTLSGKYIDSLPLKKYGLMVFTGLMVSMILLSQVNNVILLIVGLLLVRWFGQGLMTHTSSTGIAKFFDINRGKALGFTALGHPTAQFILPLVVVPLVALAGWRWSLIYLSVTAIVLVIPSLLAIQKVTGFEPDAANSSNFQTHKGVAYLKSLKFWIISSNIFVVPFICTAVFLYQYMIGQSKGWDYSWVAFSFAFYAIFSAGTLLFSGSLVDRFSGVFLFPLYLIPTVLALTLISITDYKWVFPMFYSLLGMSSGLGVTVKTAMLVEIYGTGNLGKIRSYFSTILVLSTALGPPLFGHFLDKEFSLNTIMAIMGIGVFMVFIVSFKLWGLSKKTHSKY
jgi:MFS family permease